MAKLTRLAPEDRENLAAYLDGELEEEATRRIEAILTSSEVARNDVDLLGRTYDMLNLLPRTKASGDFTERTVATAKLDGLRKPASQQHWFRQAQRGMTLAGWMAVLLIAGACGYSLTHRWISRPDDVLLQQLPLLQNLDVYIEIDNIEFLEALSKQKPLLNEISRSKQ